MQRRKVAQALTMLPHMVMGAEMSAGTSMGMGMGMGTGMQGGGMRLDQRFAQSSRVA